MSNFSLKTGWISSLRNDEYPMLVEQVCDIMDDHDLEDQEVANALSRVKSHLEALQSVKSESRRYKLTSALRDLADERRRALRSLRGQVKALTNSSVVEEREAAKVLMFLLDKKGVKLIYNGYMAQTRRVNELLADLEADAAIGEVLELLSLNPLLDSLRDLNNRFSAMFIERNHEAMMAGKVNYREIRNVSTKDVKLLLSVLESHAALDTEGVYTEAVGDVKKLLDYYSMSLAIRKGRNAAEEKKESESDVDVSTESETL